MGTRLAEGLVVAKGPRRLKAISQIDSYSAFFDNAHRRATGPGDYFKQHSVGDVYLLGLALDYCVKFSALDACQLGFRTHVIVDACRGIGLEPGDLEQTLDEMKRAGATLLEGRELR